jgi:hypothetical protein
MKVNWSLEYVSAINYDGSLVAVCSFLNRNAHIVVNQGCWGVVHRGVLMDRVYSEALAILKQLPDKPDDYQPYRDFVSGPVRLKILKL